MEYELARRDYETNRLLYDGLQERLQEASIMSGLHSTAIHTIDAADTPIGPSLPRHSFNRSVGMALGFVIGVGIALLLEATDTNLKTMTEIEQALQLPLVGCNSRSGAGPSASFRFQGARRFARCPLRGPRSLKPYEVCERRSCFRAPGLLLRSSWSRAPVRPKERVRLLR